MRLAHTGSDIPGKMNETLRRLAEAMQAEGARVVGAVQVNREPDSEDVPCDMDLKLLPDGPHMCISQSLGPGSTGCRLDTEQLEAAVHECGQRLAKGADLFFVNKFGSHEAEGRGFRDLIGTALAEDVAVVVGVTEAKLDDFRAFSGDMAEELPCDFDILLEWCRAGMQGA
ncbi:DUF2478 domain-containing protein [Aliiruegeria sabulilitoris]|uniref:DUF2478 domain-containing protein n=1 Tax=Aliiruegeria sabulilitoris TaxID=1510458 RepID=UPI00082E67EB|nr:DUF2478 domain-containing protein [Aliiruegeria sabulilitoris]NDR56132.1 DUF2478 domain-containing protein [Pseudoruegeria sp. M32A2M]